MNLNWMNTNPESAERKASAENAKASVRHPTKILLIEDDESYAQLLAYALEQRVNCDVIVATEPFEAANQMSRHPFDLVITDWKLPPFTGFSALRKADQGLTLDPMAPEEWFSQKKTPVIVVTACDADEVGKEKRLKGRFHFLGVVSKGQELEGILDQIQMLYGNFPLSATG